MDERLREAFAQVRAEEDLKQRTLAALAHETNGWHAPPRRRTRPLLTAAACLPENRLGALADGLKKLVTWLLTGTVLAFTLYLSVVRVITGSADAVTVKVAKAAISGVVP